MSTCIMSGCQGSVFQQHFLAWEKEVSLRNDFIMSHGHKLSLSHHADGWPGWALTTSSVCNKIITFIRQILPLNALILTAFIPKAWRRTPFRRFKPEKVYECAICIVIRPTKYWEGAFWLELSQVQKALWQLPWPLRLVAEELELPWVTQARGSPWNNE